MQNPFDKNLPEAMQFYLTAIQAVNPAMAEHYRVEGNKLVLDQAAYHVEIGNIRVTPNPIAARTLLLIEDKLGEILARP